MIEFGDYLFIEEDFKTVAIADFFKTLPVQYEHLKKWYNIIGRADKISVLIGAKMDPKLTIVLQKKIIKNKVEQLNRLRSLEGMKITYFKPVV
jgi:hypothetical protein